MFFMYGPEDGQQMTETGSHIYISIVIKYTLNVVLDDCFIYNIIVNN